MRNKIYSFKKIFCCIFFGSSFFLLLKDADAQTLKRTRPTWWLGQSVGGNFNHYRGTTQMLNESVSTLKAFHNGDGLRLYFSLLAEYRRNKVFGGMLNVAFNNRSSSFDGVMVAANAQAFMYTVLRYINIEPSLRIAPFSSAFYFFAGPTLSINTTKEFFLEQPGEAEKRGSWSNLRKYVIGAQAGAGIDIPISKKESINQVTLSPFISYQTDLLDGPRTVENWTIYGYRAGMAFKFGTKKNKRLSKTDTVTQYRIDTVNMIAQDIHFSIRTPKLINSSRGIGEVYPLVNSIFFNVNSTVIPNRYNQLSKADAARFKENELYKGFESNLYVDRNRRQLNIYHNILNILGDRLRSNPGTTINLSGVASDTRQKNEVWVAGIKEYLVNIFGIDPARITINTTAHSYLKKQGHSAGELALLEEEDRRVDITSSSPELTMQVSNAPFSNLRPVNLAQVQQDPSGNTVFFTVDNASDILNSYTIEITDEKGQLQKYGPYTGQVAGIPSKTILGVSSQGNYEVSVVGISRSGKTLRKTASFSLIQQENNARPQQRYSVLFDFDKSKTAIENEKFVTDIIAPLVTDSSYIFIHGHADVIGSNKYNMDLSGGRVEDIRKILEQVLITQGRRGVKIQYYGFGENPVMAPFENNLPEERFYNRTVFIEIIPK